MFPIHLYLSSYESYYSLGIFFRTYHVKLVADVETGILVGDGHVPLMTETCADEGTSQKLLDLNETLAVNRFVAHFQRHQVWLLLLIFLRVAQSLFFLMEVYTEDVADSDDGTYDAQHTQGVSAGIT